LCTANYTGFQAQKQAAFEKYRRATDHPVMLMYDGKTSAGEETRPLMFTLLNSPTH
jgi:hypothetical protein